MDVLPTAAPERPAAAVPRGVAALATATAIVLLAAVVLTAVGGGLIDNVAADTASSGSGLLLGALAETMLAVLLVGSASAGLWRGRLGAVATVLSVAGLLGMVAGGIATAVTGDHEALGVVYVTGALLAFVGFVLLAVAAWRAGRLPRPLMVLMAVGFVPLLPPAAALADIVALVWLAVTVGRRARR